MTKKFDRIDCLITEFLESSVKKDLLGMLSIYEQISELDKPELIEFLTGISGAVFGAKKMMDLMKKN